MSRGPASRFGRRVLLAAVPLAGVGAVAAACGVRASTAEPVLQPTAEPMSASPLKTFVPPTASPIITSSASGAPTAVTPAPTASPTAGSGATPSTVADEPAWTREWTEVVAAAKREGALSLLTVVGAGYRTILQRFEQEFPGITVQHLAESSVNVWRAAVRQGRRSGVYAFDVALVSPDRALVEGRAEGMWAPVKPLLFRPDVLDAGVWRGGVDARYFDSGGSLCFDWEYQVVHAYAINMDFVREGEIKTAKDLLDPRWRGRMVTTDPRLGSGLLSAASVSRRWGPEVVERLLVDQRPKIDRGGLEPVTEALARGQYAIALGVRPKTLNPLRERGIGHNVRFLDLPDADFVATNCLWQFDRAPHPASARLFANWILTREAQTALAGGLRTNSARTDVEAFEPDGTATPGMAYYEQDREANYAHTASTLQFVRSVIGPA